MNSSVQFLGELEDHAVVQVVTQRAQPRFALLQRRLNTFALGYICPEAAHARSGQPIPAQRVVVGYHFLFPTRCYYSHQPMRVTLAADLFQVSGEEVAHVGREQVAELAAEQLFGPLATSEHEDALIDGENSSRKVVRADHHSAVLD